MSKFESLRRAAVVVDRSIETDVAPDLADTLAVSSSSRDYAVPMDINWSLVQKKRNIALPDAVFEQYDLLQCRCFMGLFPSISRAWITIDHRLFLWNYQDGNDLYLFDEQDQIIVSVGLVKPLPGVFVSSVDQVLVVATPLEVFLLGVAFTNKSSVDSEKFGSAIILYQTQMSTPADGVNMTSIIGTKAGRIFMVGSDGHVYELVYQAEEGWFSRKCKKVNLTSSLNSMLPGFLKFSQDDGVVSIAVDDERNLLYMLTKNSNVEMVSLGDDGKSFNRIARLNNLRTRAATMAPGSFADPRSFRIVSIQPITLSESQWWSLVAVTSNGTRLYFSSTRRPTLYQPMSPQPQAQGKTYSFDLVHVRLPSQSATDRGLDAMDGIGTANIHQAFYSKGLLLAANAVSEDVDVIQGAASDLHSQEKIPRPGLVEVTGSSWIDAKTWSIAPVPSILPDVSNSELANQCLRPPRSFLVLTNIGISVLSIQRPIDILTSLLQDNPNSQTVGRFFDHFGRDQSAAMCLAIASSQVSSTSSAVLRNALYVYLERGGEAVQEAAPAVYSAADEMGRALATPNIRYSGRLNGLALLFGRIVRSLWKQRLVRAPLPGTPPKYDANITPAMLANVKRPLAALDSLKTYMPDLALPPTEPGAMASTQASQSERQLMYDLWQLIGQTLEAVEFLDVMLREFTFVDILPTFSEVAQKQIVDLDFEGLTVTQIGRKTSKDLVMAIVNKFIGDQVSVDVMSNVLQQRCPSFVSGDDISVFKGMESLKRAHLQMGAEREALVKTSLNAFSKVAGHITPERLQEITQAYEQIHNYASPVSLALTCAQAADPNKMALSWLESGQPADGRALAFENRKKYYDVAMAALEKAFAQETDPVKVEALKAAYASDDVVFLYGLYDWLVERRYTDKLLDANTPYLERYLSHDPDFEKTNLLWQYYVKTQQNMRAARILSALADTPDLPTSDKLVKRVEYLSTALSNAKSYVPGARSENGEFLRDLEERLEVAQVQLELRQAIAKRAALGNIPADQAKPMLETLDTRLLDISDLYNKFARPLGLDDIILLILHVSAHRDPALVSQTWNRIVEQAEAEAARLNLPPQHVITDKISDIGKRFYPDENVCSAWTLVKMLTTYGFDHEIADKTWIIRALRNVGVSYRDIFETLDRIFDSRPSPFQTKQALSYLVEAMCLLVDEWINAAGTKRDFPAKQVDEALNKFMVSVNDPTLSSKLQSTKSSIRSLFTLE